jgi:beta-aspartyl-dipeptidase (metallo-type)
MKQKQMLTLLTNANLYAPCALGRVDILIAGEKIVAIESKLNITGLADLKVIDLGGQTVVPGFIDGHVHLIGGGGEGGFATRTPEVVLSKLTMAGVTTVAGLLGTDCATRHNTNLYAKTKGLNQEGITAVMFTGGYAVPSRTVTNSVHDDIVFLDVVVGLKLAVSDHRCSFPTLAELQRLTAEARVAGLLASKCGRVVVHMGMGRGGLAPLQQVIDSTEIPIDQFIPTHVNRYEGLFSQALEWVKQGGIIDLTSGMNPEDGARGAVKPSTAIARCIAAGVDLNRVCISSDGNGSVPRFDDNGKYAGIGVSGFGSLLSELQDMVNIEDIALEDALTPYTIAPANALGLGENKGEIKVGKDADLLVLNSELEIVHTMARGVLMVQDGEVIVRGSFE